MVGVPFQKGQSGNPNGRPKMPSAVRELARASTEKAINKAIALIDSADENVSLKAINTVLDRAWGKPAQAVTGEDGEGPVQVAHQLDLTSLPADDRDALRAILSRRAGEPDAGPSGA